MKYFDNCRTLDELKTEYRRLARIHHPDIGGDVATMQEINRQYEAAFNRLKNGAASTSGKQTNETAGEFVAIINALVKLQGITVELCGSWLWISGDTKPVKDDLKAAGCRWAAKKAMWYWHPSDAAPIRRHRSTSMAEIRGKYGSRVLSGGGHPESDLCTA